MIGRTVMVIMLVEPPAVAESQQEIGVQQAENFIARGAAENFLMAGVVHDEAELREDEGEEGGVAEFDPEIVMEFGDQDEGGNEHDEVEKNFSKVERGLFGHQAALSYES